MIELNTFELPPIGTNAYILLHPDSREAVLIDAPLNAHPTAESLLARNGLQLTAVLYTHGHWDHMLDGHRFTGPNPPTYAHEADKPMFEDPGLMASFAIPGLEMKPAPIDHWIDEDSSLQLLGEDVRILHVPGHSPGSIAFYFADHQWVFSGDALFAGSVGRTDFPGCSAEDLLASIQDKLLALPDETRVFPGHGPDTTIGHEKETNPFLRDRS